MPQLNVTQNAIVAQPGMAFDAEAYPRDVVSGVCSVNIPFGVLCELVNGSAQPVQGGNLAGTVTVTAASAAITFSAAQTLPQGQPLVFSDQPGVVYYLAAAINAGTAGTLTANYSGAGGAGKLARLAPYATQGLLGISMFDPLGVEQAYTTWGLTTTLAGTVSVTNGSKSITFSQNQTLPAGQQISFSSQPGVIYQLASAITAGTAGTLVTAYSGATAGSATSTLPPGSSQSVGWRAGMSAPFMRRGRIWAAGDGQGTATRTGPINVWHSSTGANPQGVFTFSATSMVAGAEIDVAPNVQVWNRDNVASQYVDPFGNAFTVYPVEILA